MDDHRNFRHPADEVKAGGASVNIQSLEERLADLKKQFRKASTTFPSADASPVNPCENTFPNHSASDTTDGLTSLNSLIDNIWDLRRQQERRFDPLPCLGDDIMYYVFLYAVNLWDIAESRAWEPKIIPKYHLSSALVLTSVSKRWSEFVVSSSRLWSYLLIDTDDEDALEYLQLFLHLSRNHRLFIVLHGRAVVCDDIVMDLLRVGNRIDGLVYESDVSRSTLAKFGFYLREPTSQLPPWYKLEVQSVMQPQQDMDYYSFPTSIHGLWMNGLFPLPKLITLSHFRWLSSLSVKIGLDRGLPLVHEPRLELPNLERLRLQMGLAIDQRVDRSILIICRNLKVLNLQYALKYDLGNPLNKPATWMKLDIIDKLQELQIQLELAMVNNLDPPADEWLLQYMREQWEPIVQEIVQEEWLALHPDAKQERQAEQVRVRVRVREGQAVRVRRAVRVRQAVEMRYAEQQRRAWQVQWARRVQRVQQARQARQLQLEQQAQPLEQHRSSVQMWWREWLSLPYDLQNVQHSSLEVTLPPQMHGGIFAFIRDMVEGVLLLDLPRAMELTTSKFLRTFPSHLQKLYLHGSSPPISLHPITLHNLISLEIKADGLDHLIVMRYIQVPNLRDLWVQVQDGPGALYEYDWRNTTSNVLNSISLRIKLQSHKQAKHVLVFCLPRTHSLNISSPDLPLSLCLAEPAPLPYTLCAKLDKVSAVWQENSITEWINPHHGIPDPANFGQLMSLQRIVLDNAQYILQNESPIDQLCDILAKNIYMCPQLTSITVAQCPSSWPRFLHQLRMRNAEAMRTSTKCIETLSFYQPLHAIIIRWLTGAIKAKVLNVVERPPIRRGKPWPVRPFPEGEDVFGSCYICHITGMELGCLEYDTLTVDCGRERGDGSKVDAF